MNLRALGDAFAHLFDDLAPAELSFGEVRAAVHSGDWQLAFIAAHLLEEDAAWFYFWEQHERTHGPLTEAFAHGRGCVEAGPITAHPTAPSEPEMLTYLDSALRSLLTALNARNLSESERISEAARLRDRADSLRRLLRHHTEGA